MLQVRDSLLKSYNFLCSENQDIRLVISFQASHGTFKDRMTMEYLL